MDEHEGVASDSKNTGEIGITMEVLNRVDLDLAYFSEKITNFDKLLMHIMARENDLEAMSLENSDNSIDLIEKSFTFDFLLGFLDYEVKDLDNFMGSLEEVIINARAEISVFRDSTDLFEVMEAKLHDSEDLLKQSREHVIEICMQSTKLTKDNDWVYEKGTNLLENTIANADERSKMHTVEQKRHILRMLEKSLGRELDLEKKLSKFKQNEEDLKFKQRLTEQVAFAMEEAAEAVWVRFLEAENAEEVLLATSKEMVSQLQIVEFNLKGSMQREDEAKSKIINCNEQLKGREITLQNLERSISVLISDNMEVCSLREKVKMLEEQIKETDTQLKNANALNKENEENILEMENIIESLKENIDLAENRADSAEAKITELTETNSDLNEELNFLKGTNDNNTKKISSMEKQMRDLEIQLQHARASSEASQEQQNMLYTAIWDMETLIEELKSKASKVETKTENAEEQCILLSESNVELNKEAAFLRSKVESLEACLEQANEAKVANAKDVNVKTKIIMDMIVQLALERERIQKQMFGLVEANKVLAEKLQKSERGAFTSDGNGGVDSEALSSPKIAIADVSRSFNQIDESSKYNEDYNTEPRSSDSANSDSDMVSSYNQETTSDAEGPNGHNQIHVYIPIFVLLVSFLTLYFFNKKADI